MAITHSAAVRGTLAQAILTAVDAGSTFGKIVCMTSGDADVATFTLQKPSFSRSGAVLTLLGVTLSTVDTHTGTIAKFKVVDSDDAVVYQGTASTSGADLTVDNTSVTTGQTCRITAHSYTAAL